MAHTFLKARGTPVGASSVEAELLDHARAILSRASETGVNIALPADHVIAASPDPGAPTRTTAGPEIEAGFAGFDIGPRTREAFVAEVRQARTIFWNGPLGRFEVAPFDEGTNAIAQAIAATSAFTVVGGGDSCRGQPPWDSRGVSARFDRWRPS
jgi:phosphoglycerate kinase